MRQHKTLTILDEARDSANRAWLEMAKTMPIELSENSLSLIKNTFMSAYYDGRVDQLRAQK